VAAEPVMSLTDASSPNTAVLAIDHGRHSGAVGSESTLGGKQAVMAPPDY
jgi:hypothetical protein